MKDTYTGKYDNLKSKKIGEEVAGSFYVIDYTTNEVIEQGSIIYQLLFEGTTMEENTVKGYWLASPSPGVGERFE